MFIQQLFNGLMLGSTYALIAIAFTLLMGILNMLNFAIGEVFMLGAIFGLTFVKAGAVDLPRLSCWPCFCAGVVSLIIERFSFRPLRHAPPLVPLLSTIGFSILLAEHGGEFLGIGEGPVPPVDGAGGFSTSGRS